MCYAHKRNNPSMPAELPLAWAQLFAGNALAAHPVSYSMSRGACLAGIQVTISDVTVVLEYSSMSKKLLLCQSKLDANEDVDRTHVTISRAVFISNNEELRNDALFRLFRVFGISRAFRVFAW